MPEPSYNCEIPEVNAGIEDTTVLKPSESCPAPLSNWDTPSVNVGTWSFNCCVPSASALLPSTSCGVASASWLVPSVSWSAASCNSLTLSFKLSIFRSSVSRSDKKLLVAIDIIISSSKSVTSAVTSKYSGTSKSSFSLSNFISRLSFKPGIVIPNTTLLSLTSVIFPFVTSILENLSDGSSIPVTIVNGT